MKEKKENQLSYDEIKQLVIAVFKEILQNFFEFLRRFFFTVSEFFEAVNIFKNFFRLYFGVEENLVHELACECFYECIA